LSFTRLLLCGVFGLANYAAQAQVAPSQAPDFTGAAPSAAKEASEATEVPGGDIFGFTSGTDVGKVGDRGVALENSGAYGVSNGRWRGVSQKLEVSGTFVENWSFAASLFTAWSSLKNNSDFPDRTAYNFDGGSVEVRYRAIERSAANPFALTLAVEPRVGRVDAISGLYAPSYGAEFKAQVDAPVADRLFWAANANFATGRSRDPIDLNWTSGSDSTLSTALTYEVLPDKFFLGAEARWSQVWRTGFFGRPEGQALYVGPTVAWKPNESVMLNAAFLPQVSGKARGVAGPLDLDNFERANYRLKLAIAF
jgi:hypothetical protein